MNPVAEKAAREAAKEVERHRALLDARSAALARRGRGGSRDTAARTTFLVCACGPERVGLPLAALAGVLPQRPCTPVPGAPAALRGIIAHAGAIVSVIDLGRALGIAAPSAGDEGHLVRLRAQEPPVALAVGRVLGLAEAAPGAITAAAAGEAGPGPGFGVGAVSGYCPAGPDGGTGVGDGFSVIDVAALLRPFLP